MAASGGRLHPVCALWKAEAAAGLPAYLATGRRSLRGFAEAVGYEAVEWPSEPFDPFFNINDEADLAAPRLCSEVDDLDRLARPPRPARRRGGGSAGRRRPASSARPNPDWRAAARPPRPSRRGRRSRGRRTGRSARPAAPGASAAPRPRGRRGPASSGASSSRAVTIAEVGLPGRPMTSLPPRPAEPDRLARLDRDLREDQLQPGRREHRLGEILLADRGAAGDDDQVGRSPAPPAAACSIAGRSSRSRRASDDLARPISSASAATPSDTLSGIAPGLSRAVPGSASSSPVPRMTSLGRRQTSTSAEIGARRGDQRARGSSMPARSSSDLAAREIASRACGYGGPGRASPKMRDVALARAHPPG